MIQNLDDCNIDDTPITMPAPVESPSLNPKIRTEPQIAYSSLSIPGSGVQFYTQSVSGVLEMGE